MLQGSAVSRKIASVAQQLHTVQRWVWIMAQNLGSVPRPRRLRRAPERDFASWNWAATCWRRALLSVLGVLGGLWAGSGVFGAVLVVVAGLPALILLPIAIYQGLLILKSWLLVKFGEPVSAEITGAEFQMFPGWGYYLVTYRFTTRTGKVFTGDTRRDENWPGERWSDELERERWLGHWEGERRLLVLYLPFAPAINVDYQHRCFFVAVTPPLPG